MRPGRQREPCRDLDRERALPAVGDPEREAHAPDRPAIQLFRESHLHSLPGPVPSRRADVVSDGERGRRVPQRRREPAHPRDDRRGDPEPGARARLLAVTLPEGPARQARSDLRGQRRGGQVPALPDRRAHPLHRQDIQHLGLSRPRRVLLHRADRDACGVHAAPVVQRVSRDRSQLVVGRLPAGEGGAEVHRERLGRTQGPLRHDHDQQSAPRVLPRAALRRHSGWNAGSQAGAGTALRHEDLRRRDSPLAGLALGLRRAESHLSRLRTQPGFSVCPSRAPGGPVPLAVSSPGHRRLLERGPDRLFRRCLSEHLSRHRQGHPVFRSQYPPPPRVVQRMASPGRGIHGQGGSREGG
jgi:hypothetical protein